MIVPGMDELARVGMVARWRPVHRGQAAVLRALCRHAREALIGIGSSNRYDHRNPFTAAETADMIRLVLAAETNYTLIEVPDLDDGPRWRRMVVERFAPLDRFVTDNPYVRSLLAADFAIARPVDLLDASERVAIDGTRVRREMARGERWRELVPAPVADYITERQLDQRFRREFGLATLAADAAG